MEPALDEDRGAAHAHVEPGAAVDAELGLGIIVEIFEVRLEVVHAGARDDVRVELRIRRRLERVDAVQRAGDHLEVAFAGKIFLQVAEADAVVRAVEADPDRQARRLELDETGSVEPGLGRVTKVAKGQRDAAAEAERHRRLGLCSRREQSGRQRESRNTLQHSLHAFLLSPRLTC